ncbi:MAG: 5-(carboxyamino)imidazole ribonucleotide mutase [Actinomycetota bacterium]|jgi:5-(carboxyamino)imidazole ribonucleotide mutase
MKVAVLMGSANDAEKMSGAKTMLERFGIEVEEHVMSAHRNPADVAAFATGARDAGYAVLIGGAGLAAHLAGVLAAHTTLPVIGVPLSAPGGGGIANGLDALLATVQMPSGIPVATVAVDGSKNAGILAAQIIALSDPDVAKKLDEFKAGGAR